MARAPEPDPAPVVDVPIRDAASLILVRNRGAAPSVLMGRRGATASFMPRKFVFPGGAVDPSDHDLPLAAALPQPCAARLTEASRVTAAALMAAAIRELWEETGQILGSPGVWSEPPRGWRGFAATGHLPDPSGMRFVFRAVTPPGRPRRFDARFLLADAECLMSNPDDFSRAEDELESLQWVPLAEARQFDLPFITQVVLAEVAARLGAREAPPHVPYYLNGAEERHARLLGGASPLDQQRD